MKKLFVLFVGLTMLLSACDLSKPIIPPTAATEAPAATQTPYVLVVTATNVPAQVTPTSQPTAQAPAETQMPEATVVTTDFPLKGLRFPAYAGGSLNENYDFFVENDGRIWQKWLKEVPGSCNDRKYFSAAIELPEGKYTFNGIFASLTLDPMRNGKGAENQVTVERGNDLRFEVKLPAGATYKTAWVLIEGEGGCSAGADIWYLGPLSSNSE